MEHRLGFPLGNLSLGSIFVYLILAARIGAASPRPI